ncbi:hypothetical protein OWV82_023617 [Melia azedarach]|uniref:Uncharacterized protein n=1 Tax=Melia azedarach TaxID=155640 RepID=A0ACC1WXF2_MELAZ|nr:hypothetical protein OWV82_023617 [Melia azedarach]
MDNITYGLWKKYSALKEDDKQRCCQCPFPFEYYNNIRDIFGREDFESAGRYVEYKRIWERDIVNNNIIIERRIFVKQPDFTDVSKSPADRDTEREMDHMMDVVRQLEEKERNKELFPQFQ